MGRSAYEDAVNAQFIELLGEFLARYSDAGSDESRNEVIEELLDAYDVTIGELPVVEMDSEDDE